MLDMVWFGYGVTAGLMFTAGGISVVVAPVMLIKALRFI